MKLRQSDLVWREIDGDMVLLDLASSSYLSTNRTGTYLLELLVEGRDRDALVRALVDRFGIRDEIAGADTDAFIAELKQQKLLVD